MKIGCSLKKCAGILKGNALITGDENLERKAAKFMELYDLKWNEEVTAHAHRTLKEMKRNQVQLIPLTDDVMLLNDFLHKEIQEAQQKLTENKNNKDAWCQLSEVTLAQLILFNRRRQGEASKLKVNDYLKKHTARQEDVLLGLTNLEKKLCSSLEKVHCWKKRTNGPNSFNKQSQNEHQCSFGDKRQCWSTHRQPICLCKSKQFNGPHPRL